MNTIETRSAVSAARPINAMNDQRQPKMIKKLGNTTYDVFVHFSTTSKETMTDKVMRLIRNDINSKQI